MKYKRLRATTRQSAIAEARKLCRCARMSWAGVEWIDALAGVQRMGWVEVDAR